MGRILSTQMQMSRRLCDLLQWIHANGFECTLGEAHRTAEQAAIYAADGRGINESLHRERLAIDLNIFKDGRWITSSDELKPVGLYWESIGGAWGGRFGDGNHFSFPIDGRR